MQAGAGLRFGLPLGLLLVVEHVGVAAAVAVVERERVPEEHAPEPRVAFDLLRGQGLTAAVSAKARASRFGCALIAVVLPRPVDAPMGWVGVVLPDFDEAHRAAPRFGLAFVYVDQ